MVATELRHEEEPMTWWLIHYAGLPLIRALRHVHHFFAHLPIIRAPR